MIYISRAHGKRMAALFIFTLLGGMVAPQVAARAAHQGGGAASTDQAQRVQWLRQNIIPVSSIDPTDEDFSDLMPLVKHIGNSRVVMLGEQSHGDGAAFMAKHRLIRFLHKVMGFDVLAWESGLYDCWKMDAALRSPIPLDEAIAQGIFGIWGRSGHVKPLFEYARTTYGTRRPLEMAGYDCQFSTQSAPATFQTDVLALIDRVDPNILTAKQRESFTAILSKFQEFRTMPAEQRKTLMAGVAEIPAAVAKRRVDLLRVHSARDVDLYLQSLGNFVTFLTSIDNMAAKGDRMTVTDNNIRDQRMGENFIWLAKQRYPDRKIIVWAASFHNMRNATSIDTKGLGRPDGDTFSYEGLTTMGHVTYQALKDDIYSIGFVAYDGTFGPVSRPNPNTLQPAPEDSLDWLMNQAGHQYSLIDLKGQSPSHWLRQPLVARPLGYGTMKADWSRLFDAMFFTKTMFPSTVKGEVPEGIKWKRGN